MSGSESSPRPARFVSLRWRLLLPLFVVTLIASMVGTYLLTRGLSSSQTTIRDNLLRTTSAMIATCAADLYERQLTETRLLAASPAVTDAIQAGDAAALQTIARDRAARAGLDSLILTDVPGAALVNVLRPLSEGDYASSTGADLSVQPLLRAVFAGEADEATSALPTPDGLIVYVAAPILADGVQIGAALTGLYAARIAAALNADTAAEVALYNSDGVLLASTLSDSRSVAEIPVRPNEVQLLDLGGPYLGTHVPFVYGTSTLGTVGVFTPDNTASLIESGRQMSGLVWATLAAAIVIAAFLLVNGMMGRLTNVTRVAEALAAGQGLARTGLEPTDEIGVIGAALDTYAAQVQERQDALRDSLRRQRREIAYLNSILEALPDGVIVQDEAGHVVFMNDLAKDLLGSQRVVDNSSFDDLTAVVTDVLGPALAPGVYALGDPKQVEYDGRMLNAQAAAIISMNNQRVGTVTLLREITGEVRRERGREQLLNRLTHDVQQPLASAAQTKALDSPSALSAFAREIARHAVAMQKIIVEMRELTDNVDSRAVRRMQRLLPLETLIWAVANEWRQVAQAANLTLQVSIEQAGLYILGDERRLRWAIGNLVDNAIKYTPPGGKLSLEIKGEQEGMARLRIRDNGVGIMPDELPHVFTRFFRGTPTMPNGRVIRVPGAGQGLTLAKAIIEAHGGEISLRSQPGKGTAVYFTLPLTAPVSLEMGSDDSELEGETVQIKTQMLKRGWRDDR
ncbi:MAG: PAS domain-containing protein [Chloroflexi bacterium]|nr:PAS domain-containing protein [Chloroflexota bacterium]